MYMVVIKPAFEAVVLIIPTCCKLIPINRASPAKVPPTSKFFVTSFGLKLAAL